MSKRKQPECRIGTSGYQYDHWRGVLYPEGLAKDDWFEKFAESFDTVEINNTFYHLPEADTFEDWHDRAPQGFRYILKYSRYGTHLKRLKDPEGHVQMFLERAERLKSFLGPILVQLPPHWHVNVERLAAFLEAAPKRRRWALEFRDPTWLCDEVFDLLKKHNAALCIHDLIHDHPEVVTADWVYLRFHGAGNGGDYSHQALSAAAQRIQDYLADGLDVYAYFNNDAHGYAVHNALDLKRYVSEMYPPTM